MLVIAQILADEAPRHGNGKVGHRTLEFGDGGLLLRLDGFARLVDHGSRFLLGLGGDVRLHGLGGLLGIRHDLRGLRLRIIELLLVLRQDALALGARGLGLLQGLLDRVRALFQHTVEHRPAEFREDDPQDDEGDEHRDEFVHLREDGFDAASLCGERIRGEGQRSSARESDRAAELRCLGLVRFQLACLLFFSRENHTVNLGDD